MIISKRLEELRIEKGETKKNVAKLLGVHESAYGKYELGHREPSLEKVYVLAEYFGVSSDYLLGKTDDPTPVTVLLAERNARADIHGHVTAHNVPAGADNYERELALLLDEIKGLTAEQAIDTMKYVRFLKSQRSGEP